MVKPYPNANVSFNKPQLKYSYIFEISNPLLAKVEFVWITAYRFQINIPIFINIDINPLRRIGILSVNMYIS